MWSLRYIRRIELNDASVGFGVRLSRRKNSLRSCNLRAVRHEAMTCGYHSSSGAEFTTFFTPSPTALAASRVP
jgi:hypothetical protein